MSTIEVGAASSRAPPCYLSMKSAPQGFRSPYDFGAAASDFDIETVNIAPRVVV